MLICIKFIFNNSFYNFVNKSYLWPNSTPQYSRNYPKFNINITYNLETHLIANKV